MSPAHSEDNGRVTRHLCHPAHSEDNGKVTGHLCHLLTVKIMVGNGTFVSPCSQ